MLILVKIWKKTDFGQSLDFGQNCPKFSISCRQNCKKMLIIAKIFEKFRYRSIIMKISILVKIHEISILVKIVVKSWSWSTFS